MKERDLSYYEFLHNEVKKNEKLFKAIGMGSNRIAYEIGEGIVLKYSYKENKEKGRNQSLKEFEIYTSAPNEIKEYLVPVIGVIENSVLMKKAVPLADCGSKERMILTREQENVINYLVKKWDLEEYELTLKFNWGLYNGKAILIDYGR